MSAGESYAFVFPFPVTVRDFYAVIQAQIPIDTGGTTIEIYCNIYR